jgi:DNA-binding transcriptional LysR family regulator
MRRLEERARQILELNDQAVAAARGIAIGGSVRFGVPRDFGDSWLPGVLARFSRAHPSELIEARVDRANNLVERIAEGGLDLALMWGNPSVANTVTCSGCRWCGSAAKISAEG